MDCVWRYRSPLGDMPLSSDGEALTGLWFDGQLHSGRTLAPQYGSCALPVFERAAAWLDCYFGGGRPDFAMAGAKDQSKLDDALAAVPELVKQQLG